MIYSMVDEMPTRKYCNLLALALSRVEAASQEELNFVSAKLNRNHILEMVEQNFDDAKYRSEEALFRTIQELLETMEKAEEDGLSYAIAISQWMDRLICYEPNENPKILLENGRVSLHPLIPIINKVYTVTSSSLNSNQKETGIVLLPAFQKPYRIDDYDGQKEMRPLVADFALHGINERLNNVLYYPDREDNPTVRNIVLPKDAPGGDLSYLKVLYAPLTDRPPSELLCTTTKPVKYMGQDYTGLTIDGIKDDGYIEQRVQQIFFAACTEQNEKRTDLLFFPEMLATDRMIQMHGKVNLLLKELVKQAAKENLYTPRITAFPTYWKDGTNSLFIFDKGGTLLATQQKCHPYVDRSRGVVEALNLQDHPQEVILLHYRGQQRVAFQICADLLYGYDFVQDFLCKKLGASLIIVPSFSPGGHDFVVRLPTLHTFGTSMIWGNCCGAERKGKNWTIGGCSFVGCDNTIRFGASDICKCGFSCESHDICMFEIHIPTAVECSKTSPAPPPTIIHRLKM